MSSWSENGHLYSGRTIDINPEAFHILKLIKAMDLAERSRNISLTIDEAEIDGKNFQQYLIQYYFQKHHTGYGMVDFDKAQEVIYWSIFYPLDLLPVQAQHHGLYLGTMMHMGTIFGLIKKTPDILSYDVIDRTVESAGRKGMLRAMGIDFTSLTSFPEYFSKSVLYAQSKGIDVHSLTQSAFI